MDSIDFNSFLEPQENKKIKEESPEYQFYKNKIKEASESLVILNNQDKLKFDDKNYSPDPEKNFEFSKWLIFVLFDAKKNHLNARKNVRKKETHQYTLMANKLYLAFDKIPENFDIEPSKDSSILTSFNWSKMLYYNELAICYSGLNQSSMSLGYAEQSIWLLEKLYPKIKNFENESRKVLDDLKEKIENDESPLKFSQILRLYTFALYNRGEAQRLLHNEELSLKIFQRVIEIYKKSKELNPNLEKFEHSDFIEASKRKGMIFADNGRGTDAIKVFDEIEKIFNEINKSDNSGHPVNDYRFWETRLEKSIALIDGKDYKDAFNNLEGIKKEQGHETFINRKTRICSVYLLNEFKKNNQKDSEKKTSLFKNIEKKSNAITASPDQILKETIERQDGNNFKRVCNYLADYFIALGNEDESLKYLYLFLFYRKFFENKEIQPKLENMKFIDEWMDKDNDIWKLLRKNRKKYNNYFLEVLDSVDNEDYLNDFFNLYIKISERKKSGKVDEDIVKKLKTQLIQIYTHKENLISLEKIEDSYNHFQGSLSKNTKKPQKDNTTAFIERYFFDKQYLGAEKFLLQDSIVQKMTRNTNDFISKVVGNSDFFSPDEKIVGRLNILRRWNSFTPALSSPVDQSKGGGYFLYIASEGKSLGVVIDPGYNFLENFFSQGFRIGDIDIVLVSHAHPDHTDNLPSILSLFYEMNIRSVKNRDNEKRNKKVLTLILSPGVFEHYGRIIKPSEEILKDIIVVDMKESNIKTAYRSDRRNKNYSVEIQAFGTSHKDLSSSKSQSLGFKIIVNDKINKSKSILGYTSDARWNSKSHKWSEYFNDCTIICAHLGSLVNIFKNKDFCKTFCENFDKKCDKDMAFRNNCERSGYKKVNIAINKLEKQNSDENHLYLSGLASFFNNILSKNGKDLKLAIISEFGEELKDGIRIDLSRKLESWFSIRCKRKEKPKCLPGDIGLEIDIFTGKVYCHCCKRFVDRDKIKPIPYGREEAIFFVCKECESVLSSYLIGEKLKEYHENGRKLELADES